jgi:DNA processing protein
MEFGREVFAVPGNVTQPVSFARNLPIKQGAKLVTNGDEVIQELPTPVRAALVKAEQPEASTATCWQRRAKCQRKEEL